MSRLDKSDALRRCKETFDVREVVELSRSDDADVRYNALRRLCPCKVKDDVSEFWERIFEMTDDSDARVRAQVLHTVCDGSPAHLESRVVEALESFNRDKDKAIRRKAHKVLAAYHRTGRWNVL